MNREFDASLSDAGVHVFDPFSGTGTFLVRLMQSGLVKQGDLKRKYEQELHANDIVLLAYYIAAINIESTYHDVAMADHYQSFNGIILTDTFQDVENCNSDATLDNTLFAPNSERVRRQLQLDIRIIVGNPPWSSTNNREYPFTDGRVRETYARNSSETLLSALYDPYVKAIRLASDRMQEGKNGGIVAFVLNGGFIESSSFDGFRKVISEEFETVYCYNLRGYTWTKGSRRRREGGNVFGEGSRAGVAVLFLVKKAAIKSKEHCTGMSVFYSDIGDYLDRNQKLEVLRDSSVKETTWEPISPNSQGDWVNKRSDSYLTLRPLTSTKNATVENGRAPVFKFRSLGVSTNRDAWCYNSSLVGLKASIQSKVEYYNEQLEAFVKSGQSSLARERVDEAKSFVGTDPSQFHWRPRNFKDVADGVKYAVDATSFRVASYRPFFKQRMYFSKNFNERVARFSEIYPSPDSKNLVIAVSRMEHGHEYCTLMTDTILDLHLTGDSDCYPRWSYISDREFQTRALVSGYSGHERVSNINPDSLRQFRQSYASDTISEDDIFFFTYGVLHSKQWRETFAADLAKSQARIPMARDEDEFRWIADSGRKLADLHVNYESVEPYPLKEVYAEGWNEHSKNVFEVTKMSYGGTSQVIDRTRIKYNANITLTGIPERANCYVLGSDSALDWIIKCYKVSTDSRTNITNDPNDWAIEVGNPRYILDLVKRITMVSIRTVDIVEDLPELPI